MPWVIELAGWQRTVSSLSCHSQGDVGHQCLPPFQNLTWRKFSAIYFMRSYEKSCASSGIFGIAQTCCDIVTTASTNEVCSQAGRGRRPASRHSNVLPSFPASSHRW